MDIPQIRMQSQPTLISIQTYDAEQTIQQPKATQQITQPKAEISMSTTPPKLTIDQSQAWNDIGLKSAKVMHEEAAKKGYQKVMQGISRRTTQGETLMKIENNSNPISAQAIENGNRKKRSLNIGWIPSVFSVKTDYQPSQLDIQVQVNQPIINNTPSKPIFNYQRGAVETGIRQEADLQIDFENLKFQGVNHYELFI